MDREDRSPTLKEFEEWAKAEQVRARRRGKYWAKKRGRAGGVVWSEYQRSRAEDSYAESLGHVEGLIIEFSIWRHQQAEKARSQAE